MDVACAICGTGFVAKRSTARYCSERCKKKAQRNPDRPVSGPLAPVTVLPRSGAAADVPVAGEIERLTRSALSDAGRSETVLGAVAVALAAKLDSPGLDTGSSVAALARQLQASLAAALEGTSKAETPLERMKRQRALKAG